MSGFLWESGRLGWSVFALVVFSGLWLLLSDAVWRLWNTTIVRLAAVMASVWIAGVVLIVLGFHFFSR